MRKQTTAEVQRPETGSEKSMARLSAEQQHFAEVLGPALAQLWAKEHLGSPATSSDTKPKAPPKKC